MLSNFQIQLMAIRKNSINKINYRNIQSLIRYMHQIKTSKLIKIQFMIPGSHKRLSNKIFNKRMKTIFNKIK